MKKFIFLASSAALLALSACSSDEPSAGNIPDGTKIDVTFSANIPSALNTRAYGDGTTAKDLYYAVYDKDGNYLFEEKTEFPQGSLHKDVSIQLVTGETYQIVFWAQSADASFYSFDAQAKTMTATYPTDNNAEILDAFYVAKTLTVNAQELNQEAELKRPLCQVNIATADNKVFENQTVEYPTQSAVTFTEVPNVLNLLDGSVSGETEVSFSEANLPDGQITVNGNDYDYLSMTYFLAPTEGDVQTSVSMQVNNLTDGLRQYSNIPVKRNYKTNIVGDLLTSKTLWDVYINPIFDDPDIDIIIGSIPQNANGAYEISAANQLAVLQELIASTPHAEGNAMKIVLTQDINMGGMTMTPLQLQWVDFDGQGHSVSNVVMGMNEYGKSGFAAYLGASNFQNLTLENVTVSGAQAGIIAGQTEDAKLSNITVKGTNTVLYAAPTGSYQETYNGVGAMAGVCAGSSLNTSNVTFAQGSTVNIYMNGMQTVMTEFNDDAYYTSAALKASDSCVHNGTINRITNTVAIATGEGFRAAANLPAGNIDLLNNIKVDVNKPGELTLDNGDYVFNGNGKTIYGTSINRYNQNRTISMNGSAKATFNDVNFVINEFPAKGAQWAMNALIQGNAELVFNNCSFSGLQTAVYISSVTSKVTFNNCRFNTASCAVQFEDSSFDLNNLKFNNCDFGSTKDILHVWDGSKQVTVEQLKSLLSTCKYIDSPDAVKQTNK